MPTKKLSPFVVLNCGPQHRVLNKMSEKSKGKRKMEYVEVSTDDGEVGLGGRERQKEEEEEEEVVVEVAEVEEFHDREEEELHQAICYDFKQLRQS